MIKDDIQKEVEDKRFPIVFSKTKVTEGETDEHWRKISIAISNPPVSKGKKKKTKSDDPSSR